MQREFNANRYEQYVRFAEALITEVSKEDVAQCARILALALARYQATYGDLPTDEDLSQLESVGLNPATDKMRADGMEHLVSVLASVAATDTRTSEAA